MNGVPAVGIGAAVLVLADRFRFPPWVAAMAAIVVWRPAFGILALVTVGAFAGAARRRRVRAARRRADSDVASMARILLISLSAGLSMTSGLQLAGAHVGPLLQVELNGLLRQGARVGMAEAMRRHTGRAERLALLLARAHVTGSSVGTAVSGYVAELRDEQRSESLESARKLPVKLTIPLALLILPGFVVLTVGPTVLDSAQRLLGPIVAIP